MYKIVRINCMVGSIPTATGVLNTELNQGEKPGMDSVLFRKGVCKGCQRPDLNLLPSGIELRPVVGGVEDKDTGNVLAVTRCV